MSLLAGLLLWTTAHACGPFFPHTLLGSGNNAVLSGPYADLSVELSRLDVQPPKGVVGNAESRRTAEQADARRELGADSAVLAALERFRQNLHEARRGRGPVPELPAGLPPAWHQYLDGARAHAIGDTDTAVARFSEVAQMPATDAQSRGLWALYMLGRTNGDLAALQELRRRVAQGAPDSLGLAASGLGWQAQSAWHAGDVPQTVQLYVEQHAAGDPTALQSIEWLVPRILEDPDLRQQALADPLSSQVVTAWLVSGAGSDAQVQAWLVDVPAHQVSAELRAWLAWLVRDIETLNAALPDASETPMTRWLSARAAMLRGDLDAALALLESADFATDETWTCRWYSRGDWEGRAEVHPAAETQSELGVLRLRDEDGAGALQAFAAAGHWFDTAHVAERVVSTEELVAFVDGAGLSELPADQRGALRALLSRRLFRAGDLRGASRFATPERSTQIGRYEAFLAEGTAPALWEAARLLRSEGMELAGTELGPDFAWSTGSLEFGDLRARSSRTDLLAPTSWETSRMANTAPTPNTRFHYRYQAAELVWRAAERIPEGHPAAPRMLCQAGRWLMHRDPTVADRFYKEMVWRGWGTPLGAKADALRWFPPAEDCALETVDVDAPPPWWGWAWLEAWWGQLTGPSPGTR